MAVKQVLLEEGLTLATAGKKLNKDVPSLTTMRAELIGHFKPCMTEIYLHIDARMADYIRTHPYACLLGCSLGCGPSPSTWDRLSCTRYESKIYVLLSS